MIRFVYLQDPRATFFLGGGLGEKDMLTLGIPRCLKFSFFGQQTKNSIPPLAILRTWPFWDGEWVHVTFWKGWLFATNPTNLGIKSGHSLNHPDDHYDCHYYYDDDDYYYHYHYYHHFYDTWSFASPSYFVSLLFSWMLSLDSVFLALSFSFSWFLSSIYRYLVYISNIHKLKKSIFSPKKISPKNPGQPQPPICFTRSAPNDFRPNRAMKRSTRTSKVVRRSAVPFSNGWFFDRWGWKLLRMIKGWSESVGYNLSMVRKQ